MNIDYTISVFSDLAAPVRYIFLVAHTFDSDLTVEPISTVAIRTQNIFNSLVVSPQAQR